MKTAIYIEDGREQIVLTPETDMEKTVLAKMGKPGRDLIIARGSFYRCQGGWTRQGASDDSVIIVLNRPGEDQ